MPTITDAGWSSPVARQAHNLKVTGSNPVPATKLSPLDQCFSTDLTGFFTSNLPFTGISKDFVVKTASYEIYDIGYQALQNLPRHNDGTMRHKIRLL